MVKRRLIGPVALLLSSSAAFAAPEIIEIRTVGSEPAVTTPAVSTPNQSNRELLLLVEQLQSEVRSLRGQLERQDHTIRNMESQQLNRYRDLDRRISTIMSEMADLQKAPPVAAAPSSSLPLAQELPSVANTPAATPTSSTPSTVAPPVTSQPTTVAPAASAPANLVSDRQAYRDAYELVRANQFDDAIAAMKQFIESYPESARVTNAYFWMGEVFHAQTKLEEAREAFTVVVSKNPQHPKAPLSAYKLAVIYLALGDTARAKEYADYVLANYPDASVVPLVQDLESKL